MTCSISSPLLLLLLLSSSLERIQVAKRSLISTFPCALFMPPSVKTCLAVFSTCKTTDGQALASATRVNTDTVYFLLTITANDVVANWYQEASRFKYGREPVSIQGIAHKLAVPHVAANIRSLFLLLLGGPLTSPPLFVFGGGGGREGGTLAQDGGDSQCCARLCAWMDAMFVPRLIARFSDLTMSAPLSCLSGPNPLSPRPPRVISCGVDDASEWVFQCGGGGGGDGDKIEEWHKMVWASSRNLGVGRAIRVARDEASTSRQTTLLSSKIVIVCFYFPPGNVASYFTDNVHPPLAEKEASTRPTSKLASKCSPSPPKTT
ncbi:unnamed protein product [Hydatigera taeniaeformis]|uniref:N-acetyltransferase domain-containing protein n=1 Tax=Hydatigena taeniaeformis TaxID=6205 RepID=A0A0R3X8L6_HYDTA|nr:unnamed protein product [Hydatigera taeniaeformis]